MILLCISTGLRLANLRRGLAPLSDWLVSSRLTTGKGTCQRTPKLLLNTGIFRTFLYMKPSKYFSTAMYIQKDVKINNLFSVLPFKI